MLNDEVMADAVKTAYGRIEDEYARFKSDFKDVLVGYLKRHHLDGLVRSKETGKCGYIEVCEDTSRVGIMTCRPFIYNFYPLTDKGVKSKRNSWFYCPTGVDWLLHGWKLLSDHFEPAKKGDDK